MDKTCTLEQAKRLKELGVEQKANSTWTSENDYRYPFGYGYLYGPNDYAAFDTDELLAMMPHSTAVSIMPITDILSQSRLFCAWLHNIRLPYISGKTTSSVLAKLIISANENKAPGFSIPDINERIKQYTAR